MRKDHSAPFEELGRRELLKWYSALITPWWVILVIVVVTVAAVL